MSSDITRSSGVSSKLSQFGLYRTIDARTEEFLKMSRKRQIRRGCACAAVSAAITVVFVVMILLIYEYAIAAESSLVQRTRWLTFRNHSNETLDKPFADRLDRSYFGFDQDYYERMPLLVNAMQENSYVDPSIEGTPKPKARFIITNLLNTKPTAKSDENFRYSIRRTSPRPFIFEYKHPTPEPFGKKYGSRSWVESYRNAQKLKNLKQVIKYLETTINAKFGDLYTLPTSTIAFSGIYVEPTDVTLKPQSTSPPDLLLSQSTKVDTIKTNPADWLYNFKPKNPGDVNLLADSFFRFAPHPTVPHLNARYPMFRQIKPRRRFCKDNPCDENGKLTSSDETKSSDISSSGNPKAFSVLVNLFPLTHEEMDSKIKDTGSEIQESVEYLPKTQVLKNIYITTAKPVVQFRRKSIASVRRIPNRLRNPKVVMPRILEKSKHDYLPKDKPNEEPKMIVHLNVYDPIDVKKYNFTTISTVTSTKQYERERITDFPILASTQVEDYHVGSSGIIPVRSTPAPAPPPISTHPSLPLQTTTTPFYDHVTTTTTDTPWITPPADILKFSQEDAKVPDHYKKLYNLELDKDDSDYLIDTEGNSSYPAIDRRNENNDSKIDYIDVEPKTLIIKLRNEIETTTQPTDKPKNEFEYDDFNNDEESSSMKTYVPQINGHYRSINQNSRNINNWLNIVGDRKRRLATTVSDFGHRYVEIKRNRTKIIKEDEPEHETEISK